MSNKSQASIRNALYDPNFYIQQLQGMPIADVQSEKGRKEAEINNIERQLHNADASDTVLLNRLNSELQGRTKELEAIENRLASKKGAPSPRKAPPKAPTGNKAPPKALTKKRAPTSKGTRRISKTQKAGLQFPVARVRRYLQNGPYSERIGVGAGVYLAGVLEYLTAEILELAGNAARDNKKKRIIPRHIMLAVRNDEELQKILGHVTFPGGGVLPLIHKALRSNNNTSNDKA